MGALPGLAVAAVAADENGRKELDRVHVTSRTKPIEGIAATVVADNVYEPIEKLAEKTFDYYAHDDRGNVWYLGEDTREFLPGGKVDTSGSWLTGRDGAKPGLIMEADPRVPDAYRQECRSGEAEDLAWVVDRGGANRVPYRTSHHVLRSLEFSRLEPAIVDQKVYGPGGWCHFRAPALRRPRDAVAGPRERLVDLLVQLLAAVESAGDVEGLPL